MSFPNSSNLYGVGFGTTSVKGAVISDRDPAATDITYDLGQVWVNKSSNGAYILTSKTTSNRVTSANWEASTPGTSEVDTLTGDSGGAISPDAGTIIIAGGSSVTTVGTSSPGTITVNLDSALVDVNSITAEAANDMSIISASGQDIIMQMGDASGTNKVSFTDSGAVEVASINSDGDFSITDLTVVDLTATGTTQILGNNAAASTVTIASGVGGNTVSINNGINTSANTVNISGGAAAANSTVNILSGNGSAGTQTLNALTGTRAGALNLATGAAAHVVAIGSASAGAITVDTAAGISLDAATASNLTVTGAADLAVASTLGGVNITSGEAATSTGITLEASAADGGITMSAGTGGILIGNQADCTTIDVGDLAPTAARTITVGGGTVVTASITDTIDIGPDGATTNADSIKRVTVNNGGVTTGELQTEIASGVVTSGTKTVSIAAGDITAGTVTLELLPADVTAGTVAVNLLSGTGTKTLNIGNSTGTTTNIDGPLLVNDSVNSNTSINTGTSTGTITIGNAAAGAIAIESVAGVSVDAGTASAFTVSGATEDLTLESAGGTVIINAGEDAADAIYLHANGGTSETIRLHADLGTGAASVQLLSDVGGIALTAAPTLGVTFSNSLQSHQMLVGSGSPNGAVTASQGSLYVDVAGSTSTTILFANTDGGTTWVGVGA